VKDEVAILGTGLAALSCAALLVRHGARVVLTESDHDGGGPRPLVLSESAVDLIRDVHETPVNGWRLDRREVRWGQRARSVTVDAPALVVDGAALNRQLAARVTRSGNTVRIDSTGELERPHAGRWSVCSITLDGGTSLSAGRRHVISGEAPLTSRADPRTALVRSGPTSWVHLAPVGPRTAVVQAMVPGPVADPASVLEAQVGETGLADMIERAPPVAVAVPAAPRLQSPLRDDWWLSVGNAAARLDPLSGSGVLHALRTAVLGAAVIDAVDRGMSRRETGGHFANRIHQSFRDHLSRLLTLYSRASFEHTWQDELDTTALALRALGVAGADPQAAFRLTGVRLERLHTTRWNSERPTRRPSAVQDVTSSVPSQ
jgi:flavin-dependent dehydrogenase